MARTARTQSRTAKFLAFCNQQNIEAQKAYKVGIKVRSCGRIGTVVKVHEPTKTNIGGFAGLIDVHITEVQDKWDAQYLGKVETDESCVNWTIITE